MTMPILTVPLAHEHDVVAARQRARQIAGLLGFDEQDQTRIATAVSEIARNAYAYAGGGRAEFVLEGRTAPQVFVVRIEDHGPGIPDVGRILDGTFHSRTGMGLGIVGTRRLLDQFDIESRPNVGTTVWLRKILPRKTPAVTSRRLGEVAEELARRQPTSPLEEVQRQNHELLRTLEELRRRQDELVRLNGELEDTNRGVVALYAELDEKADHLRRADEMKSRFLSNMSHEFRTPLHSILALTRLLIDRADGPLTDEQAKQVGFVRRAAEDLLELVNDLLDLAKVEAGKTTVRAIEFDVANLFGALRGMLRPLLVNESVALVFDDPVDVPPVHSDEGKISQILRNFISNALKFTERGEVRVSVVVLDDGEHVRFSVADTGIGIAAEDQERIFQEFAQVEHHLQRQVKGTGLGLPLTRRLAQLLGGEVSVQSAPGVGSTFFLTIPLVYTPTAAEAGVIPELESDRLPVLVVENRAETQLIYRKFLRDSPFQPLVTRSLREARQVLRSVRPRVIVLDIRLQGEDSWGFLAELKAAEDTREIPVLVASQVEDVQKGLGLGADVYCVKPLDRQTLVDHLTRLTSGTAVPRFLVVDDEEVQRYLLRRFLAGIPCTISEAAGGEEALGLVREQRPTAIFLDLAMPGMTGFEVLERLKADPATRGIPVIVLTGQALDDGQRRRLAAQAVAIVAKDGGGREPTAMALRAALARAGVSTEDR